ncbi:MAG: amidase family protein, partial [Thalassobaculaceae bacterium]
GLAAAGATLTPVDLDDEVDELRALHRLISGFEFRRSVAFEKFQHRDRLSAILRDGRLADGEGADLADYHRAMARAVSLRAKLAAVFDEIDILLAPPAPGPALATLESTGDAAFAAAWTLIGHPSLSLPLFRAAASGLPLGCQVIGGATTDARLLSICKAMMARFAVI